MRSTTLGVLCAVVFISPIAAAAYWAPNGAAYSELTPTGDYLDASSGTIYRYDRTTNLATPKPPTAPPLNTPGVSVELIGPGEQVATLQESERQLLTCPTAAATCVVFRVMLVGNWDAEIRWTHIEHEGDVFRAPNKEPWNPIGDKEPALAGGVILRPIYDSAAPLWCVVSASIDATSEDAFPPRDPQHSEIVQAC